MSAHSYAVQSALKMLPSDDKDIVWDQSGKVGMPREQFDAMLAEGKDPFAHNKLAYAGLEDPGYPPRPDDADKAFAGMKSHRPPISQPQADPRLATGESGSSLSPEPDRPSFGPLPKIPGMAPEQVDAVYKMAAEQAKPQQAAAGPTDDEKMKMAMDMAELKALEDGGWAKLRSAGRDFGLAIGGKTGDTQYLKDQMAEAQAPVGKIKEAQALGRSEKARRDALVRQFTLDKIGIEDKKADNDRADKTLALAEKTAAGQDQTRKDALEQRKAEAEERANNFALSLEDRKAAREQAASLALAIRAMGQETMEGKRKHVLAERMIPGYSFAEGAEPSAVATKTMQAAVMSKNDIEGSLDIVDSEFKKYGQEVLPTDAKARLESELMGITNKLRVLNKMGVPNGKDYEMLEHEIPMTITEIRGGMKPNSYQAQKLKSLRARIDRTVAATAKAYGYVPDAANAPTQESGNHSAESLNALFGVH